VVGEERVRVVVGHVVGQVVTGGAHENGEEVETHHHRVEDVVGPDRQALVVRLERVTPVTINLDHRDLLRRCCGGRAGSFLLDVFAHGFT